VVKLSEDERMSIYIGIDLGSTSITAVAIDSRCGSVISVSSAAQGAEVTLPADRARGRSEWDIDRIGTIAIDTARELVGRLGSGDEVVGIGVTGQQQGLQVLDAGSAVLGPYISWQDQRLREQAAGDESWLALIGRQVGAESRPPGLPSLPNTGCPMVPGYTAFLLYWLARQSLLPSGARATTVPEWFVGQLTATQPVTDPTDAVGWGVFDLVERCWNESLIEALGLRRDLFPELVPSCVLGGELSAQAAAAMGLPSGLPVAVAAGDHQCSFAGSVADFSTSAAINVGTGGQSTVYLRDLDGLGTRSFAGRHADSVAEHGSLELRPFLDGGYLLAGVGVVGGRTLRTLGEFFAAVGESVFGLAVDPASIYPRLIELAAADCEDRPPHFAPYFTGTRIDANAAGVLSQLRPGNFTPGQVARALFEGMADEFHRAYAEAVALGAGRRDRLVGSGNGLRLNPVLCSALESRFGMQVLFAAHREEAAVGAGLCASVASGECGSIAEASRSFVRYEQ